MNRKLLLTILILLLFLSITSCTQPNKKYIYVGDFTEEEKKQAEEMFEEAKKPSYSSSMDIIAFDYTDYGAIESFTLLLPKGIDCRKYNNYDNNITKATFSIYDENEEVIDSTFMTGGKILCADSGMVFSYVHEDEYLNNTGGEFLRVHILSDDDVIDFEKDFPLDTIGGDFDLKMTFSHTDFSERLIYFDVTNNGHRAALPKYFADLNEETCNGTYIVMNQAYYPGKKRPEYGETKQIAFHVPGDRNFSQGKTYCMEFWTHEINQNITFTT